MPMVTLHRVGGGESNLFHLHVLDARDPGFGGGHPGGVDPGFGHGGGFHPSHGLPGSPGHPSTGLPGGGYPSHGLPGSPGTPGNELPTVPPPQVAPGEVLVLVRNAQGQWVYAAIVPGSPPPRPLPSPGHPSGQPIIPPGTPHPGQPLPPTAAPKA